MKKEYNLYESFSLFGEDVLFLGILKRIAYHEGNDSIAKNKTYLDIGAHHPVTGSNTFLLKHYFGWQGTLVEPNPTWLGLYRDFREGDFFIQCAVDVEERDAEYYSFGQDGYCNTINKEFAKLMEEKLKVETIVQKTKTVTMSTILEEHKVCFKQYPFLLDMDIEGSDFEILKTIPQNIRIPFIMIEEKPLDIYNNSEIREYMKSINYEPVGSNFLTTIYMDSKLDNYKKLFSL